MTPDAEARVRARDPQPYGAVLAVGPTGCGKTTTLYAALDLLNDEERVLMTIEDPVEYQIAGHQPDRGQLQERPHLRARAAHDPALRPRRAARRRDPRRGDRAHRDPGGDDRPPRADDAAHAQRGVVDRAPRRTWASSRACSRRRSTASSRSGSRAGCASTAARPYAPDDAELAELGRRAERRRRRSTAPVGCASCGGTGYARPRRALRGDADPGPDAPAHRAGSTEEIFAAAVEQGMRRCARTASASRSRASRRSTRSAASPATGSPSGTDRGRGSARGTAFEPGRSERASL